MRVAFLLPASVFAAWALEHTDEQGTGFTSDPGHRHKTERHWHVAELTRWTRTARARIGYRLSFHH